MGEVMQKDTAAFSNSIWSKFVFTFSHLRPHFNERANATAVFS